jgi:hypothetical protein
VQNKEELMFRLKLLTLADESCWRSAAVATLLAQSKNWHEVYSDDLNAIFVRSRP